MNSIERVKAALHFSGPDKVPLFGPGLKTDVFAFHMIHSKNWQPGHIFEEKGLFPHPGDNLIFRTGLYRWKKPDWAKIPKYRGLKWMNYPREEIDEWGCIWNRIEGNLTMGHPGRPSLPDWKELDKYLEKYNPDPTDPTRYSFFTKIEKLTRLIGSKKYRVCALWNMGPVHLACNMRGFSHYLVDHAKHPNELKQLLNHLTEFFVQIVKSWIKFGSKPHGFVLADDLGSQVGPYFSPQTFKKFYEPVYRRIIEAVHEQGCELHLHSCGKVDKLLPSLIEWGLDAIEFDSPRMSGYTDLKPYRGKIMFWASPNIQSIYPNSTPDEVRREIWHMIRNLGTENGGFGLQPYAAPSAIEVTKENVKAMFKGHREFRNYSKIPPHWWKYPTFEEWDMDTVPPLPPLN
ncbi:MAG: uroporphyrinogen decarboxylase family protein [Promethearchaeota archaeon]